MAIYIILAYFILFFIIATIIKNNSIVDIGWGLGYVVTAWIIFFIRGYYSVPAIIINILVTLWGLRLFYYILKRNVFAEEDFRYKKWREDWGKWVIPRAFLQIFILQGFFMFVVGSGVFYMNDVDQSFRLISIIGIIIWAIGYLFEVISDYQLRRHLQEKNTSILTSGLWKYSRHPNYFGEALLWWGIFIIVILNGGPFYYIISPIVITYLLRFVSGVPLLEKRMSTKEGWNEYASKTNAFIPWIPKK